MALEMEIQVKKIICLILALMMLISVVSCTTDSNNDSTDTSEAVVDQSAENSETNAATDYVATDAVTEGTTAAATTENVAEEKYDGVFKVGYARTVITPALPFERKGEIVDNVKDDLYVTCVAVNDGENTALLYTIDLQNVSESFCSTVALRVKAMTKVPVENIFISATHTHSSFSYSSDDKWKAQAASKMATIAKEAIADLSDAEIYVGVGHTPGMAFVRRYVNSDGTYSSINPTEDTIRCVADADDTLQVIRFVRADKKDVIMTNWQGHLAHAVNEYPNDISADLAYYVRTGVEQKDDDTLVAYYAGASGNINLNAPNAAAKKYENYQAVGKALAKKVLEISTLDKMTKLETGKINATRETYNGKMKKDSADVVAAAKAKVANGTDTAADRYIVSRNSADTKAMILGAISFGDLGFVSVPYEMFDTNGVKLRNDSPFEMTFILTNAWGDFAYMPSYEAWTIYGGYETTATYFDVGVAEKLIEELVGMLKSHKK